MKPGMMSLGYSPIMLVRDNVSEDEVLVGDNTNKGELAEAIYYLCSDAAKYITGVILPVDGGNSIGF